MNIREELTQLRERIDQLEQQLEPEITEGQYWEETPSNIIYRIMGNSEYPGHDYKSKPINYAGCDYTHWRKSTLIKECTLLSNDEVEQALIKEAKRRGFDEAEKWKPLWETDAEYWEPTYRLDTGFEYIEYSDKLYKHGTCIYHNGTFAEIIEDGWEVWKVDGENVYVVSKKRTILDEELGLSETEAHTIKNALNNLHND